MKLPELFYLRKQSVESPHRSKMLESIRTQIHLAVLLAAALIAGCAGHKNIKDIGWKKDPITNPARDNSSATASIELKRMLLPPDELAMFERFNQADTDEQKIELGFKFVSKYPRSLVAPRIWSDLQRIEARLWGSLRSLLSTAKANPDKFLTEHVVNAKKDEFLTNAVLFITYFPNNPHRDEAIRLIQSYVETMQYAYVTVDKSDPRLGNQKVIGDGEKAFGKFYRSGVYGTSDRQGQFPIWSSDELITINSYVVVSIDGKRAGVSSIMTKSDEPPFLFDYAVSLFQVGSAIKDAADKTLAAAVRSGVLDLAAMDEYRQLWGAPAGNTFSPVPPAVSGQQTQPQRTGGQDSKKRECYLSCRTNWVDTCGRGLHTNLPGANYTPAECDQFYHDCLDVCERKSQQ